MFLASIPLISALSHGSVDIISAAAAGAFDRPMMKIAAITLAPLNKSRTRLQVFLIELLLAMIFSRLMPTQRRWRLAINPGATAAAGDPVVL